MQIVEGQEYVTVGGFRGIAERAYNGDHDFVIAHNHYMADGRHAYNEASKKLVGFDDSMPASVSTTTTIVQVSNPFLQIETVVVGGYHTFSNGLDIFIDRRHNGELKIDFESGNWNKSDLSELVRILNEISEAM